ncbi:MAG: tetratricopeptide repeat protein [Gammaproteobacteria bacterium]|uniref:YfgM family protein n=1 Tax=Rhodoferax sp. TaxID=50421 RepID=UPI0018318FAB|nr:tetratricopeptide repeat protein [Rhodoferax sp.]MBU3899577.1 tetratricopeptide repeat protein [Gammaproteobacteria bacterium]MBA3059884.1 tetratricopeptide repeat protein [Rhodoferax sp.]MBU3998908.1 tetratricopeptide repeat protein [Gammaproteobacteria bacterium]MBU4018053.1 tetratricopeptide repeat protein [Gammaproteobacteria bacterium]MBU4080256.1 tetratricopeptide repeat protein [Gammaproteobacteria bacterium]
MAKQLDLEEQEQLDEIKHFWKTYGNAITWALIVVLGAFASWNFYQYWQRNQATQAAAMYDEVERVVTAAETAKVDRAFADMKDRFSSTTYAHQAGLLVAKYYYADGNVEAAKSALGWVADKGSDPGYQAVAKLRLAGIFLDSKAFDEALKLLGGTFPSSFEALVADRKGDILLLQGKRKEAISEYEKAFKGFDQQTEYRRLVEVKLNSLGVDPLAGSHVAGSTTAGAGPVAIAPTLEGTK